MQEPAKLTQAKLEEIYRKLIKEGTYTYRENADGTSGFFVWDERVGDLVPLDPDSDMGRLLLKDIDPPRTMKN